MKLLFNEEEIAKGLNKIYLEDDDVDMICEYLEKEGDEYALFGSATIEGEVFHEFKVVFQLLEELSCENETLENIMSSEWDWYDFDFS